MATKTHTSQIDIKSSHTNAATTAGHSAKKSRLEEIFNDFNPNLNSNTKDKSFFDKINDEVIKSVNRMQEFYIMAANKVKTVVREIKELNIANKMRNAIIIGTVGIASFGLHANNKIAAKDIKEHIAQHTNYKVGVEGIKKITENGQIGLVYKNNTAKLNYLVFAEPTPKVSIGKKDWVAYELNGLTNKGIWYQCTLQYRNNEGFGLLYEIWGGAHAGPSVFLPFKGKVHANDKIDLELHIKNHVVYMNATDIDSGAFAKINFSDKGDTFVGKMTQQGYYTGIMTEFDIHTHTSNWNIILPYDYIDNSGVPTTFNSYFQYYSLTLDKHMHDIHGRNGKYLEYIPKMITLVNRQIPIDSTPQKHNGSVNMFDLSSDHVSVHSQNNVIYIGPRNN